MQFRDLFTKKFLFEVNPIMIGNVDKMFGVAGAIMVVLAAVMKFAATFSPTPADKRFRNRLYHLFLVIGLLEILWYGLRYQNIRYWGTHFAALLVLAVGLVWFGFIVKDFLKNYRTEKESWEKEQVRMKYLPK